MTVLWAQPWGRRARQSATVAASACSFAAAGGAFAAVLLAVAVKVVAAAARALGHAFDPAGDITVFVTWGFHTAVFYWIALLF